MTVTTDPETLDYQAGCAFRDRDFDKARAILTEAALKYPEERDLWAARLDQIEAAAPKVPEVGRVPAEFRRGYLGYGPADYQRIQATLRGEQQPTTGAVPSPLPEPGKHRDGGPTTASRFGLFDRAPDPGPEHHCPSCTTYEERDGRTYAHGPMIGEHEAECQGCAVDAGVRSRPAPVHDVAAADRSSTDKSCAKCGEAGVGPGGIICPPCRDEIEARHAPGKEQPEAEAGS